MRLYNTMTRKMEELQPKDNLVKLYCCGPTMSGYAHIGNLRSYIVEDILHKVIKKAGFELKHVMNITDVGHLTSDGDEGEDKVEMAAKKAQKSVLEMTRFYEDAFLEDCAKLHIVKPDVVCRATEYIDEMIEMAKGLEEKGFAYFAGGNLYFDTAKFPKYGELAGQKLEDRRQTERAEVDLNKKNYTDFVLWFTSSKFENHILEWDSPWGKGYPGWHLECSAMSLKNLGENIDIHCGGIDNLNPHHENEIAQSEAYLGHDWVKTWLHVEHLNLKGAKMAKSSGTGLTVATLEEKGYTPEEYRYLCLTAHYKTQMIFTYDNLDNARNTYNNLVKKIRELKVDAKGVGEFSGGFQDPNNVKSPAEKLASYITEFNNYLFDDLKTPQALATMQTVLKDSSLSPKDKLEFIANADDVFSLGLTEIEAEAKLEIPEEVQAILDERAQARTDKDFAKSDELRDKLASMNYTVKDTADGQEITPA